MVTRGTWVTVRDRDQWSGRRDAGRAYLETAQNALVLATAGTDGRPIVHGAVLSAIAYADALTIKVAGVKNGADHQRLVATLRHALGKSVKQAELTHLGRLLDQKDESAYGHRRLTLADARAAVTHAEAFAAWAEGALVGG